MLDQFTKKRKGEEIKNNRPVLVLSSFSKIYQKFVQEPISNFLVQFLSEFILWYRKIYSTNHVLLRLIDQ